MLNKMILQGHLTADPELKYTPSGVAVVNFTIAWNEKVKNKQGQETENTLFMRCIAWRGTAELIANHFQKGKQILAEGRCLTNKWEDEKGTHSTIQMTVESVNFCGKKEDNQSSSNDSYNSSFVSGSGGFGGGFGGSPEEEDLPF